MGMFVKVAAVQAASVAFDLSASLDKLAKLVTEAKQQDAQLVVFPEAFLSAYPRYLDFVIGTRTEENREWFRRYVESSVRIPLGAVGKPYESESLDQPGEFAAFHRLQSVAASAQVYLSLGVVERSHIGATLWCTLLLFAPSGVLLSRHRKIQPTAAERVVWSQGQATTEGKDNLPVVKTDIGRVGGLICWENYVPLARYLMYKKGVDIYLAPTADGRPTWTPTIQHIAQEGRCFVVSVNQFHASADFPTDYPPNFRATQHEQAIPNGNAQPAGKPSATAGTAGTSVNGTPSSAKTAGDAWCRGGSCIVGPLGQILAGPLWDKEGIITADLDLDDLIRTKVDFDPTGHYSREELLLDLLHQ